MASLRLLIVLSIVVFHSAQAGPKCLFGKTIYNVNGDPLSEEELEKDCPLEGCRLEVTRNEVDRQFTIQFDCANAQTGYSCKPETFSHGGSRSYLDCYCRADDISPCNEPALMFDTKGDPGEKERAASLANIGIDAETSVKAGEKTTKFVWNADFGKKCINWNTIVQSSDDPDITSITREPCSSRVCFMKIKRNEVDKTFELEARCASASEKDANQIVSGKMYECKPNTDKLMLNCYCTMTDIWPYCNSPQSLFDDKGTDEQRKRNDQLTGIGISAATSADDESETNLHWDEYFGKKCMHWSTIVKSNGDPEKLDIRKNYTHCSSGLCYMHLKRNQVEKTFKLNAGCIPTDKNTTCKTIPEDLTSTCFCKISNKVCNSVENLFNHHDGGDKLTRYQRLRVIGLDTNLEKKEIYQILEGDIKFDNEFRKTTTTEATTTTLYTGPYEPPFADDPYYAELEDAATGVSLTFVVLIAILRLI